MDFFDNLCCAGWTFGPTLYEERNWIDLPPEAQGAAELLGCGQCMWDNQDEDVRDIVDTQWINLNDNQQEAAAILGYDEQDWDDKDD